MMISNEFLYNVIRQHRGMPEELIDIKHKAFDVAKHHFDADHFVRVTTLDGQLVTTLFTEDEFEQFVTAREQAKQWADAADKYDEEVKLQHMKDELGTTDEHIAEAINPDHYNSYLVHMSDDLQWVDTMSRIPTLRRPERFIAALEMQIRKYMDRNGQKDDERQEWRKALWYMKYLNLYIANGCKPIKVEDYQDVLSQI